MAERFGYVAIKNAIVTLLGTTAVSDLNSGLPRNVQKIDTRKPDNIVIPDTQYPFVNVWFDNAEEDFRGASTRKEAMGYYEIDAWVKDMKSLDSAIDTLQLLIDNIAYIFRGNVGLAAVVRGYVKLTNLKINFNTDISGFVAHAKLNITVIRLLN